MNILVLGPQGSGKGTQAKLLVEKLNYQYFETGDVLREKAKEKSSLGQEIDRIMNQEGKLVSNQIMRQIVGDWLDMVGVKNGIVFDGYPRSLAQHQTLQKLLSARGIKIDKVIYLKISREVSIKRLSARRICPQCDVEYNLVTKPPKKAEFCDRCQRKLIQRRDDTPEMIGKRLETYHQLTQPLIDFFSQQGILEEVDGERPIEVIHQDIVKRLGLEK